MLKAKEINESMTAQRKLGTVNFEEELHAILPIQNGQIKLCKIHQGNGEQFTTKKWSLTKMVSDAYGKKDTRFTNANDGMEFMTTGNEEK